MWNEILSALKTIVADIESKAGTYLSIFISFMGQAVTEEEAALWPQFLTLANQIFNDEVKMAGLNVDARVAVVVADFLAQLPSDIALAKTALVNSWAWAVAHQKGLVNGNQGILVGGSTNEPSAT